MEKVRSEAQENQNTETRPRAAGGNMQGMMRAAIAAVFVMSIAVVFGMGCDTTPPEGFPQIVFYHKDAGVSHSCPLKAYPMWCDSESKCVPEDYNCPGADGGSASSSSSSSGGVVQSCTWADLDGQNGIDCLEWRCRNEAICGQHVNVPDGGSDMCVEEKSCIDGTGQWNVSWGGVCTDQEIDYDRDGIPDYADPCLCVKNVWDACPGEDARGDQWCRDHVTPDKRSTVRCLFATNGNACIAGTERLPVARYQATDSQGNVIGIRDCGNVLPCVGPDVDGDGVPSYCSTGSGSTDPCPYNCNIDTVEERNLRGGCGSDTHSPVDGHRYSGVTCPQDSSSTTDGGYADAGADGGISDGGTAVDGGWVSTENRVEIACFATSDTSADCTIRNAGRMDAWSFANGSVGDYDVSQLRLVLSASGQCAEGIGDVTCQYVRPLRECMDSDGCTWSMSRDGDNTYFRIALTNQTSGDVRRSGLIAWLKMGTTFTSIPTYIPSGMEIGHASQNNWASPDPASGVAERVRIRRP